MSEVDALVAQLQEGSVEVRRRACEQLCHLGEGARRAAAALVRATGAEESVSQWAVAALEELGPPDDALAPELAELSGNSHELIAYWAITLLGRLGPQALGTGESLNAALQSSPHNAVRQRAAWALGRLGTLSDSTRALLRQASQASDPRLARLATQALETSG